MNYLIFTRYFDISFMWIWYLEENKICINKWVMILRFDEKSNYWISTKSVWKQNVYWINPIKCFSKTDWVWAIYWIKGFMCEIILFLYQC